MLNRCLLADEVSVTVSHCAFINYTSLLITEAGAHDGMQWLGETASQTEEWRANSGGAGMPTGSWGCWDHLLSPKTPRHSSSLMPLSKS